MDEIGTGHFAVVCRIDKDKVCKQWRIPDKKRIKHEADILRLLGGVFSPHLFWWDSGSITMEEIPGVTLETHHNIPIAKIVTGLADAVRFMHEERIVHRDIKPSNIIWTGEKIKLIDFSFSQVYLWNREATTFYGGTPIYWPPEIQVMLENNGRASFNLLQKAQEFEFNKKSDFWACGLVVLRRVISRAWIVISLTVPCMPPQG